MNCESDALKSRLQVSMFEPWVGKQ